MSEFRDPDFSFLDGSTGDQLREHGRSYADAAAVTDAQIKYLAGNISGKRAEAAIEKLVVSRQHHDRAADGAYAAAQDFATMREHANRWRSVAPRDAEIDAADDEVTRAKERLIAAAHGDDRAAETKAATELRAAQQRAAGLRQQRRDADDAYTSATTRLKAKIEQRTGFNKQDDDHGRGTPAQLKSLNEQQPAKKPAMVRPSSGAGAVGEPALSPARAPTAPAAAAAGPAAATEAGAGSPTAAAAGQPMPVAGGQPAEQGAAPAAAAAAAPGTGTSSAGPAGRKQRTDFSDLAGPAAAGIAAGTFPVAAAAAVPPPMVGGTSVDGLRTATDVSGGPAKVNLSGGGATNATSTAAGADAAGRSMGAGMPMMPQVPMTGGAAPSAKERKTVLLNETEAELHGINAMAEAVRGGTILRRDETKGDSSGLL